MKIRRVISTIISLVLCSLVLLGSVTTAHGNADVGNNSYFSLKNNGSSMPDGRTTPDKTDDDPNVSFFFAFLRDKPTLFSSEILDFLVLGSKIKILGYSGMYTYVEAADTHQKGYIFCLLLDDKFIFNKDYDHIYVNQTNSGRLKIKSGVNVEWTANPAGCISINQKTKVITGIKPGTVKITAKGGLRKITCTVTCINPWKEQEISTAEKNIEIFPNDNSSVQKIGTITKGTKITAKGDLADGSGWIYVNSGNSWGFIKLSDFPGIDYLLTEYHYYDQGYNIRFGSAENKIYTYASVMNDVMMDLFNLKINPYVYSYTSPADQCKIWRYGSVKSNNLASSCPKNENHNDESCLTSKALRDNLQNTFGAGNEYIAKTAWTGHIMDGHAMSNSQRNPSFILIFTTGNTVSKSTNQNKSASVIRSRSIYELIHETSHQFGLHDHYCKKNGSPCSNQYCYSCTRGYSAPRCIMNLPFDTENYNNDELFCDECLDNIKTHLNDHH